MSLYYYSHQHHHHHLLKHQTSQHYQHIIEINFLTNPLLTPIPAIMIHFAMQLKYPDTFAILSIFIKSLYYMNISYISASTQLPKI